MIVRQSVFSSPWTIEFKPPQVKGDAKCKITEGIEIAWVFVRIRSLFPPELIIV
jgi:hypothetical protein